MNDAKGASLKVAALRGLLLGLVLQALLVGAVEVAGPPPIDPALATLAGTSVASLAEVHR